MSQKSRSASKECQHGVPAWSDTRRLFLPPCAMRHCRQHKLLLLVTGAGSPWAIPFPSAGGPEAGAGEGGL